VTLLGVAEVRAELERIIAANPDRRNAHDPSDQTCVYTDANGCHCLIGELATSLGWRLPEGVEGEPTSVAPFLEWPTEPEADVYLDAVQVEADGKGADGSWPKRWAEVDLTVAS